MKKIKSVYITAAYVCVTVFSLGFVLGIFMHWLWFLAAAAGVGGYVFLLWKYLRCPYCGRWLNLDILSYGKSHPCHCIHCGEPLEIEAW